MIQNQNIITSILAFLMYAQVELAIDKAKLLLKTLIDHKIFIAIKEVAICVTIDTLSYILF